MKAKPKTKLVLVDRKSASPPARARSGMKKVMGSEGSSFLEEENVSEWEGVSFAV
jgi:hypothetical protein